MLFVHAWGPLQIMTALTFEFFYQNQLPVVQTLNISSSSDSELVIHIFCIISRFVDPSPPKPWVIASSNTTGRTEESSILTCTQLAGCFVL